jgi:HPr kinase/phosphorylase
MNPDLPQAVVLHASCLDLDGKGVLIEGRPGAGQSDLSLRLIDQPGRGLTGDALKGARLVADDQVVVKRLESRLLASPPDRLKGLIEVRGLGIVKIPHCSQTVLHLIVTLTSASDIERMPQATDLTGEILGVRLPRIPLDPKTPSAPARVRAALDALSGDEANVISTTPY